MTIHISGQVPGEPQNGMVALEEEWTGARTPEPLVAVVIIERDGVKLKDADQSWTATMKFRHIEPMLTAADEKAARELLEGACAVRGGDVFRPAEPDTELDIPEIGGDPLDFDDPDDAA
jgi:hypothetical protein